ncbi:hypothetical protein HID58_021320, partial [Brassica napus]
LMNSFAFHLLNCSDLIAINRVEGLLKPSVSLVECHRETIKTMANGKNFSNLLFSQIPVDLDSPEPFWFGSQGPDDSPFMSAPDVPAKSPKLSKQKLLDRLLAKKEPLSDMENSSHVGRSHGSLSDGVGITGDGVGFTGDGVGITGVVCSLIVFLLRVKFMFSESF